MTGNFLLQTKKKVVVVIDPRHLQEALLSYKVNLDHTPLGSGSTVMNLAVIFAF